MFEPRTAHSFLSSGLVSASEERGERTGDGGHDEDRPELQKNIDDLASARDRVLQRRGDGQDLNRGEEESVSEAVDLASLLAALQQPHQ